MEDDELLRKFTVSPPTGTGFPALLAELQSGVADLLMRVQQLEQASSDALTSTDPNAAPVLDWYSLDAEGVATQKQRLTMWVNELRAGYEISTHNLPGCWDQHVKVVQVLLGLWREEWDVLHHRSPKSEGSGYAFMVWHTHCEEWLGDKGRLSYWLSGCAQGVCRAGEPLTLGTTTRAD